MSTNILAHFDGQHFVPDEPVVGLLPGDCVKVIPVSQTSLSDRDVVPWEETFRQLIELHPVVTHLVDDSRESIYAGRGE